MLISYPLLPTAQANATEAARLQAMEDLTTGALAQYGLNRLGQWHGGVHLQVGDDEPIRAIADGTIVAWRIPSASKEYADRGSYDTGFVLIRHETESGENTPVVFYSLYMHLRPAGDLTADQRSQFAGALQTALQAPSDNVRQAPANTRIWRKEVLGFAGNLDGQRTVHFEIFTTDEHLLKFWPASTTSATNPPHGSDDVFGDMLFVIGANQSFLQRHPHAGPAHDIGLTGRGNYPLPIGQPGQNSNPLLVHVRFGHEGQEAGKRIATTYVLDAQGTNYVQLGDPVEQDDYEYELYRLATALYPDCPSAGFELLRFGRKIGPDTTTRVENWQLVRYNASDAGYINLADPALQVKVLSDADFPLHWRKADLAEIADTSTHMVDEAALRSKLGMAAANQAPPSLQAPPALMTQIQRDASAALALKHLACHHPSEWDDSDLETRFAKHRQSGQKLHSAQAWAMFREHVKNLAFWHQAGLAERNVWFFHPLRFIAHFRKCGWLTESELFQLFPRDAVRNAGRTRGWVSENVTPQRRNLGSSRIELNKATRKFVITTPKRLAAFYGNAMQETQWFQLLTEPASNPPQRYDPWRGRGYLQLTWPDNYVKYWEFRGRTIPAAIKTQLSNAARTADRAKNNSALVAAEAHLTPDMRQWRGDVGIIARSDPTDSAGAYWSWSKAAKAADRNEPFLRVPVQTNRGNVVYYTHAGFGDVAATVNVGRPANNYASINGIQARFQAYVSALMVLGDTLQFPDASGRMQTTPESWRRRLP